MSHGVVFLQCDICKNMVGLIKDGGGEMICCAQPMKKLEANTVDASLEKHTPVAKRENGKVFVDVGSIAHPMEEKHYIEWIAVMNDSSTQRIALKPGEEPKLSFSDPGGKLEIYAYCNLHGLWMTAL